jgi:hypothetical protein
MNPVSQKKQVEAKDVYKKVMESMAQPFKFEVRRIVENGWNTNSK